ncbi:hypothetical protein WN48_01831 [Eufriesea mexicana]|nr:hypothetical protein WN48_01831 [Eufriesea mexicana]
MFMPDFSLRPSGARGGRKPTASTWQQAATFSDEKATQRLTQRNEGAVVEARTFVVREMPVHVEEGSGSGTRTQPEIQLSQAKEESVGEKGCDRVCVDRFATRLNAQHLSHEPAKNLPISLFVASRAESGASGFKLARSTTDGHRLHGPGCILTVQLNTCTTFHGLAARSSLRNEETVRVVIRELLRGKNRGNEGKLHRLSIGKNVSNTIGPITMGKGGPGMNPPLSMDTMNASDAPFERYFIAREVNASGGLSSQMIYETHGSIDMFKIPVQPSGTSLAPRGGNSNAFVKVCPVDVTPIEHVSPNFLDEETSA